MIVIVITKVMMTILKMIMIEDGGNGDEYNDRIKIRTLAYFTR